MDYYENKPFVCDDNGKLINPENANKLQEYKCHNCKKKVIICEGEKRKPYWRHKQKLPNESIHGNCCYHDTGVKILKNSVEKCREICFVQKCKKCGIDDYMHYENKNYRGHMEYNLPEYHGRADLFVTDENGEFQFINEVKNYHSTSPEKRPEPWYEMSCEEIVNIEKEKKFIVLHDLRTDIVCN